MFIQHDEYVINVEQINFIKIKNLSLFVSFEANQGSGATSASLTLKFSTEDEVSEFLGKLESK